MGAVGDLTTLPNVKAWRSPPLATTFDDAEFARAITAVSHGIIAYLQGPLISQTYREERNGVGGQAMILRNYPPTDGEGFAMSVSSVTVGNTTIPAAPDAMSTGYVLDPATGALYLRGFAFWRGIQNVSVVYRAGFLVSGEAQTMPSTMSNQISCAALAQLWAADNGVAYADGTAFTAVASSPIAGQYVPPAAPDGVYQFAAADAGKSVLISYSFTPPNVEQAAIEMVLLRFNERGRIGENSKVLAGENVSYFNKLAMTDSIKQALLPYRRIVPV